MKKVKIRYDRIIILVAAIIAIILCILGIKHIKYTHTYEYKFLNNTDSYKDDSIENYQIIAETLSSNYKLNEKVNSHMITNLEWGAIAYLSNSKYGSIDDTTTSNETGVVGMNEIGEYVMASYNNDAGRNKDDNSGFEPYGKNMWPLAYIDTYKSTSIKGYKLGDATMETNEWFENENEFVNGEYPFMIRGIKNIYSFTKSSGAAKNNVTFRSVIAK